MRCGTSVGWCGAREERKVGFGRVEEEEVILGGGDGEAT